MKIRLSEYTVDWIRMYEEEVARLKQIFGDENRTYPIHMYPPDHSEIKRHL